MEVSFWGVRGGVASPGPATSLHGGNTPCVAVQSASREWLILDAGTGIRELGDRLLEEAEGDARIALVLSHFHWDHLQGLPFFGPLWDLRFTIDVYAAADPRTTEACVRHQMEAPYFPVPMTFAGAHLRFHRIVESEQIAGMEVVPFAQHHPQGSSGFRLEEDGAAMVYATDTEGGVPRTDDLLRRHAQGASLLILDAQYTPEEAPSRVGWGHDDWRRACRVAESAGVERLLLFHHDPRRSDRALSQIEADARRVFGNTSAAREGMVIPVV